MSACRKGLINVSSAGGRARGGNSPGHEGSRAVLVRPAIGTLTLPCSGPSRLPHAPCPLQINRHPIRVPCVLSPLLAPHAHTLTASCVSESRLGRVPAVSVSSHVISPSCLKPLCSWSPRSAVLAPPPALAFLTPPPPLRSLGVRTLSGARHF